MSEELLPDALDEDTVDGKRGDQMIMRCDNIMKYVDAITPIFGNDKTETTNKKPGDK